MIRAAARAGLTALLAVSLVFTLWTGFRIARDPALRPFVDRGTAQIHAAMDRAMAEEATPAHINARLDTLLAETPRNWVAIDAVAEVAAERAIPIRTVRIDTLRAEDGGLWNSALDCAMCGYDAANCQLSAMLLCQVPVALTSIGDVAGLTRGGIAYLSDEPVDMLDVGLSAIGLGATALVVASGGTTLGLRAGASALKTARRMRLLSPPLTATLTRAVREGVDWAALPLVRGTGDVQRLLRPAALEPVAVLARNVNRIEDALPTTQTLHLMRYVDDGAEARRIANASEALGARTVGRMEVLGKARFLRATIRLSEAAWSLAAGFAGLVVAVAGMVGNAAQSFGLRALRRLSRA